MTTVDCADVALHGNPIRYCGTCGWRAAPRVEVPLATSLIFSEVAAERGRQEAKFPDQHLPNGTGPDWPIMGIPAELFCGPAAETAKRLTDAAASHGHVTWHHVLNEEFREAMAEEDPAKLRAELVQVAAVAVRWIEDLDRVTA